jgi:hypothetical protein
VRTHWRAGARLGLAALVAFVAVGAISPAAHADTTGVRINEVESSGGTPGDWIELTNTGTATADLSGWVLKDNDNSHSYTIASGTTLAPGAFAAFDVETSFGLGSSDSARVFQPGGTTLVDSYSWTSHASTTYGRCPDGVGAFVTTVASTKGAANACPPPPPLTWPGGTAVANADVTGYFGTNLSGLSYESPTVVWGIKNGPSTLYRLVPNGSLWQADTTNGWSAGKALHYANGSGDPDAEGVVITPDGVVASTERDNNHSGTSLMKVLRFNQNATGTSLNATAEWDLTPDLPAADPNSGLEGIAWIPDTTLTAAGFHDEHTGAAYDPATYPNHGTGVYFVASEATGTIYAYALTQSGGAYTRIATIPSGFPAVMDLEWEPNTGRLWAACDDTCSGQTSTLVINANGKFAVTAVYNRPSGMPNYNNEGFALAPQSTCSGGFKQVLWSDDSNDKSHALRSGTISC